MSERAARSQELMMHYSDHVLCSYPWYFRRDVQYQAILEQRKFSYCIPVHNDVSWEIAMRDIQRKGFTGFKTHTASQRR